MNRYLILIFLLFSGKQLRAQTDEYRELVRQADSLYRSGQYRASGLMYSTAFTSLGGVGIIDDRYHAACTWSLAGQPDSAFFNLQRIASTGIYTDLNSLLIDPAFEQIHRDKRWEDIVQTVTASKWRYERDKGMDIPLIARLDTIYRDDQRLRMRVEQIKSKHGPESVEYRLLWEQIEAQDSLNLVQVERIIKERGWLGADKIGRQGNQTLFLVIQHSDLSIQEKYFPIMQEAARSGDASAASLALLEDRILLRQGKPQKYGSQILCMGNNKCEVDNLEDPLHVDERRASVGLQPLAEYAAQWNIRWNAEAYLKQQEERSKHPRPIRP